MLCIEDTRVLLERAPDEEFYVLDHNPQAHGKKWKSNTEELSEILCYLLPLLIHYKFFHCLVSELVNTHFQDIYEVLSIYQPELDYPDIDDSLTVYNHWSKNPKSPYLISFLLLKNSKSERFAIRLNGSLRKFEKMYLYDYYLDIKAPLSSQNLHFSNLTTNDIFNLIDAAESYNFYCKTLFSKGYRAIPCTELYIDDERCFCNSFKTIYL